jgi:hypothetical protein
MIVIPVSDNASCETDGVLIAPHLVGESPGVSDLDEILRCVGANAGELNTQVNSAAMKPSPSESANLV